MFRLGMGIGAALLIAAPLWAAAPEDETKGNDRFAQGDSRGRFGFPRRDGKSGRR